MYKKQIFVLMAGLAIITLLVSACAVPTPVVVEKVVTKEVEKEVVVSATPAPEVVEDQLTIYHWWTAAAASGRRWTRSLSGSTRRTRIPRS